MAEKVEGTSQGQPHPSVDGLFWDVEKKQWVRHPGQTHAGVKWTGEAPSK